MSGLQEFIKDLASVEKYSELLTPQALFIAGIGSCKSGLKAEMILKYLAYTQKVFEKGLLNNTNKTIIEFHFYKGEINDAKKLLKDYKQKFGSELLESQSEINSSEQKPIPNPMKMDIDDSNPEKTPVPSKSKPQAENPQQISGPKQENKSIVNNSKPPVEKLTPLPDQKQEKKAIPDKPKTQDQKPKATPESKVQIKQPPQRNQPKMTKEEVRDCETQILDLLNVMRRIDEKESLRLRKADEEKRLQAEVDAKNYRITLEKEYETKLKKELEERKRIEDEALKCIHCKDKIKDSDLFLFDACGHTLHKNCAKEQISKQIEDKKLPIICPSCKVEVSFTDIKASVTGRLFKNYEDLTFKYYLEQNTEDYNSCPTPKCSYLYELEEGLTYIECPQCKRAYCLNCRTAGHKGVPCRNMGMFGGAGVRGVVRGQKLKSCPICAQWVEKGKDKVLRCRCGTSFCYVCSAQGANCGC